MPENTESSLTPELVRKTADGDRVAGRQLVLALRPIVHVTVARMALRIRGKRANQMRREVDDLVQDVLITLLSHRCRKLLAWDPTRGRSLPSFVGFIAQREVLSILRRREPDELLPTDDPAPIVEPTSGPEQAAISKDLLEKIYQAADARLTTPLSKTMFGWLVIDERSVEEVRELAGMTDDAVYGWRKRISDLLKAVANEVLLKSSRS